MLGSVLTKRALLFVLLAATVGAQTSASTCGLVASGSCNCAFSYSYSGVSIAQTCSNVDCSACNGATAGLPGATCTCSLNGGIIGAIIAGVLLLVVLPTVLGILACCGMLACCGCGRKKSTTILVAPGSPMYAPQQMMVPQYPQQMMMPMPQQEVIMPQQQQQYYPQQQQQQMQTTQVVANPIASATA